MNILNKIQKQMAKTELLKMVIRDITHSDNFIVTFHDHFTPHQVSIHNRLEDPMCVMDGETLVFMDDQDPSPEAIEFLAEFNEKVSKL